jgi:hypothetical protein
VAESSLKYSCPGEFNCGGPRLPRLLRYSPVLSPNKVVGITQVPAVNPGRTLFRAAVSLHFFGGFRTFGVSELWTYWGSHFKSKIRPIANLRCAGHSFWIFRCPYIGTFEPDFSPICDRHRSWDDLRGTPVLLAFLQFWTSFDPYFLGVFRGGIFDLFLPL